MTLPLNMCPKCGMRLTTAVHKIDSAVRFHCQACGYYFSQSDLDEINDRVEQLKAAESYLSEKFQDQYAWNETKSLAPLERRDLSELTESWIDEMDVLWPRLPKRSTQADALINKIENPETDLLDKNHNPKVAIGGRRKIYLD